MDWEIVRAVATVFATVASIVSLAISLKTRKANIATNRATLTVRKVEIGLVADEFLELHVVIHNIGKSTAHKIRLRVESITVGDGSDAASHQVDERSISHLGPTSEVTCTVLPLLPEGYSTTTTMKLYILKLNILYDDEASGIGYHYSELFSTIFVAKLPVTKDLYRDLIPISATLLGKKMVDDAQLKR